MYIEKILWLLSWPLTIAISYFLIAWVLKKWKNRIENDELINQKKNHTD